MTIQEEPTTSRGPSVGQGDLSFNPSLTQRGPCHNSKNRQQKQPPSLSTEHCCPNRPHLGPTNPHRHLEQWGGRTEMAQAPPSLARDQGSSLGLACSAPNPDCPHLPTGLTRPTGQGLMVTAQGRCHSGFFQPAQEGALRPPTRGRCGDATCQVEPDPALESLTLELLQLHEGFVCVLLRFLQVASLHGVHHGHLATRPDSGGHCDPLLRAGATKAPVPQRLTR